MIIQSLLERKSSSSIWHKSASRDFQRIRSEFWRRLDQRLDHRGMARHCEQRRVRGSRQKFQVQSSWNQEIAGNISFSLRRWFSRTRKSRTTSNFAPPESREHRRGRTPLHFGRRSGPLQSARSTTLHYEEGVADFSEAPRDAVDERDISRECLQNLICRHHVKPREHRSQFL